MKNGAKRLMALLLALVMAGSLAVMPAVGAEPEDRENLVASPEQPEDGALADAETDGGEVIIDIPEQPEEEQPEVGAPVTFSDTRDASTGKIVINEYSNFIRTVNNVTSPDLTVKNGYYLTINADNYTNRTATSVDGLKSLISGDYSSSSPGATGRSTYKAEYDGGTVTFNATWKADPNQTFVPEGNTDNVWYSFTADLTYYYNVTSSGSYQYNNASKFEIDVHPKAYIRVYPVIANQTLSKASKMISESKFNDGSLTEANLKTQLGLPTSASVKYSRYEAPSVAAAGILEDIPPRYPRRGSGPLGDRNLPYPHGGGQHVFAYVRHIVQYCIMGDEDGVGQRAAHARGAQADGPAGCFLQKGHPGRTDPRLYRGCRCRLLRPGGKARVHPDHLLQRGL